MGWPLAFVFLYVTLCNFVIVFGWYLRRRRGSLVPLVGGLAGISACFTLPYHALRSWWYVPLLIDLGSLPLLVLTAVFHVRRFRAGRRE